MPPHAIVGSSLFEKRFANLLTWSVGLFSLADTEVVHHNTEVVHHNFFGQG